MSLRKLVDVDGITVLEDGTVIAESDSLNFGTNLNLVDDGGGQSTASVSDPLSVDDFTVNTSITDAAGVEHTGELADLSDTGGSFSIEDSGTTVVSDASGIDFGSGLDASDDGDDTITASVADQVVSDGDGTERQIWVIENGASDPSDADAEDIIFEEEA